MRRRLSADSANAETGALWRLPEAVRAEDEPSPLSHTSKTPRGDPVTRVQVYVTGMVGTPAVGAVEADVEASLIVVATATSVVGNSTPIPSPESRVVAAAAAAATAAAAAEAARVRRA